MIKEHRTLNLRRVNIRRVNSRRFQDRRKIPFPFNSEEWVNALENRKEYVLWPVCDRRLFDRRNDDRRTMKRRLLYKDS